MFVLGFILFCAFFFLVLLFYFFNRVTDSSGNLFHIVSSFADSPSKIVEGTLVTKLSWLSVLGIAHEVSDGCSVLQAAVHRVHHHSRHIPLVRMASWSHDCPGFPVRQGEYTGSRPRPLHILLPTNLCLFICSHDCASLVFWLECKFCVCLSFLGFFFRFISVHSLQTTLISQKCGSDKNSTTNNDERL